MNMDNVSQRPIIIATPSQPRGRKEYKIPFKADIRPLETLEWNTEHVKVWVERRDRKEEYLPLTDQSKVLRDDSKHVLEWKNQKVVDGNRFEFDLEIKPTAVESLKPLLNREQQKPIYTVEVEMEVDLSKTVQPGLAAVIGPALGVPGIAKQVAAAAAAPLKFKLPGSTQVKVEFPHPFIHHQLMNEQHQYPYKGIIEETFEIDTAAKNGNFFKANLMQFSPTTKRYEPEKEALAVSVSQDKWRKFEPPIGKAIEGNGFWVKSKRLIIGTPKFFQASDNLAIVDLKRQEKIPPKARNEGEENVKPRFHYKPYEVNITLTIYLKESKENEEGELEVPKWTGKHTMRGEEIDILCVNLPPSVQGRVDWRAEGKTPERYSEHFGSEGTSPLEDMKDPKSGKTCPGAKIVILQDKGDVIQVDDPLPVDITLSNRNISITVGKYGWKASPTMTITEKDTEYQELYKKFGQEGGSFELIVPHPYKELIEDEDVKLVKPSNSDSLERVMFPEVSVSVGGLLLGKVEYSKGGEPLITTGSGSDLGTVEIKTPLELETYHVTKMTELGDEFNRLVLAAGGTALEYGGDILKTWKNYRAYYHLVYIEREGRSIQNQESLEKSEEQRHLVFAHLKDLAQYSAMIPGTCQEFKKKYRACYMNAVQCTFSLILDCLFFLLDAFFFVQEVGDVLVERWGKKAIKKATQEIGPDAVEASLHSQDSPDIFSYDEVLGKDETKSIKDGMKEMFEKTDLYHRFSKEQLESFKNKLAKGVEEAPHSLEIAQNIAPDIPYEEARNYYEFAKGRARTLESYGKPGGPELVASAKENFQKVLSELDERVDTGIQLFEEAEKAYKDKVKSVGFFEKDLYSDVLIPGPREIKEEDRGTSRYVRYISFIGPFLENYPNILKGIKICLDYIMGWLDNHLACHDQEIRDFAEKLRNTLGQHGIQGEVTPVLGPNKQWIPSTAGTGKKKYLSKEFRAQEKTDQTNKASDEVTKIIDKIDVDIQKNIAYSMREAVKQIIKEEKSPIFSGETLTEGQGRCSGFIEELNQIYKAEAWGGRSTTYMEVFDAFDKIGSYIAWALRIIGLIVVIVGAPTFLIGSLLGVVIFFLPEVIDLGKSSLRDSFAYYGETMSKARILQLMVLFPCIALGWFFRGLTDFGKESLQYLNSYDAYCNFVNRMAQPDPLPVGLFVIPFTKTAEGEELNKLRQEDWEKIKGKGKDREKTE
jgi:hypothetical protein